MAPGKKSSTTCDYLAKMRGQLRELSHLLWRPSNLADRSISNVGNFGRFLFCLFHSTPKVKFVFLQLNNNLFRYDEVPRVSGLLLIINIFESISSLFFATGPSVGKIGHTRKSVAFEAFKVQTISVHKMIEIYTIRPPNEVTRSKWKKKHLINSLPCVLVKQKELMSLKGRNTVADYCERI